MKSEKRKKVTKEKNVKIKIYKFRKVNNKVNRNNPNSISSNNSTKLLAQWSKI